ncbi:DinB family protein [Deinococcus sp.]|uniref:DinB family protein n=1 Tax=Deinococcus sp. TaxID=47478 RepID=UPI003C7A4B11
MPTQAQRVSQTFAAHRAALTALLTEIPEEQAAYSPWEGAMNFVSLGDHLDASAKGMLAALSGQAPSREVVPSHSLHEARARLQASGEQVAQALAALSDDDLAREVPAFGGRTMPVAQLVEMLTMHEAHHKGQLWVMARQVGVKPPFFVQM